MGLDHLVLNSFARGSYVCNYRPWHYQSPTDGVQFSDGWRHGDADRLKDSAAHFFRTAADGQSFVFILDDDDLLKGLEI